MVRIAIGALAAMLLASGAWSEAAAAADDAVVMRDFFTGTLEIDDPAGQCSAKRDFEPDHSCRETCSDGEVHGAWAIENGKIFRAADRPNSEPARLARYCNSGVGRGAGEKWKEPDPATDNLVPFF